MYWNHHINFWYSLTLHFLTSDKNNLLFIYGFHWIFHYILDYLVYGLLIYNCLILGNLLALGCCDHHSSKISRIVLVRSMGLRWYRPWIDTSEIGHDHHNPPQPLTPNPNNPQSSLPSAKTHNKTPHYFVVS